MAARVRPVRAQAPYLRHVEHLGQHLQGPVRLIGRVPVFVMQRRDVLALHVDPLEAANRRFDEQVQGAAVFLLRGRLAAFLRMLAKEPVTERGHRGRAAMQGNFFGRVLAHGNLPHHVLGELARLFHRDLAMPPQSHAPGASALSILCLIALRPGGHDPHAKPGDLTVPDEEIRRLWLKGVNGAFGQFWHVRFSLYLFSWKHCGSNWKRFTR